MTQQSSPPADRSAANPLAFDVGNGDTLTINPIASLCTREATATLSRHAASAAPELSQAGMLGLGITGLIVRARRRHSA